MRVLAWAVSNLGRESPSPARILLLSAEGKFPSLACHADWGTRRFLMEYVPVVLPVPAGANPARRAGWSARRSRRSARAWGATWSAASAAAARSAGAA